MDLASLTALLTAIFAALGGYIKSRDQDKITGEIAKEVTDLRKKVQDCETDRERLWKFMEELTS